MSLPKYIKNKQKSTNKVFSKLNVDGLFQNLKKFENNPNLTLEYEELFYENEKFEVIENIWTAGHNFYIHCQKSLVLGEYRITIYYDVAKHNEVKLFIKFIKKEKNGINNTRIETKN